MNYSITSSSNPATVNIYNPPETATNVKAQISVRPYPATWSEDHWTTDVWEPGQYDISASGYETVSIPISLNQSYDVYLQEVPFIYLDYIESSGTQYIDTALNNIVVNGLSAGDNLSYKIEMALSNTASTGSTYFGGSLGINTGGTYQTGVRFFRQGGSSSYLNRVYIHMSPMERYVNSYTWDSDFHTFELTSSGTFLIDDVSKTLTTSSTGAKAGTIQFPIYLFEENQSGTATVSSSGKKIRRATFYSGTTLLKDFVPVRRTSDNEAGMLEVVEGVFYPNAGTGSFIEGPEI